MEIIGGIPVPRCEECLEPHQKIPNNSKTIEGNLKMRSRLGKQPLLLHLPKQTKRRTSSNRTTISLNNSQIGMNS